MATVDISDQNFRDLYTTNEIVILDFWAVWCAPCHQFAPTFEAVSEDHQDIIFGKVDTESCIELTKYFGIRSIPTIVVIRDQLEVFRHSGLVEFNDLQMLIEKIRSLDMDEFIAEMAKEEEEHGIVPEELNSELPPPEAGEPLALDPHNSTGGQDESPDGNIDPGGGNQSPKFEDEDPE